SVGRHAAPPTSNPEPVAARSPSLAIDQLPFVGKSARLKVDATHRAPRWPWRVRAPDSAVDDVLPTFNFRRREAFSRAAACRAKRDGTGDGIGGPKPLWAGDAYCPLSA